MMAAIEAAKGIGRGGIQSVTLFEQEPKLGRKLAVTGGAGRCNLSNDGGYRLQLIMGRISTGWKPCWNASR